jgi:D-sedoheptulose 7-phosphate isomerase
MNDFTEQYLKDNEQISRKIDRCAVSKLIGDMRGIRENKGRIFILGVGGSAANASHAVNDFRKIAGIEAYSPTDNAAELTAWINDDSWDMSYVNWLKGSRLSDKDACLVLSVGGGSDSVSRNLVEAMKYAKEKKARLYSIVSRDGGYAKKMSDICVLIPVVNERFVTAHAEGWQAVLLHLIVNGL